MIFGAHFVLFSKNAEADRDFFRDILKFPHVDAVTGGLFSLYHRRRWPFILPPRTARTSSISCARTFGRP